MHQPFTHGHLYVALSRIINYNRGCFFTTKSNVNGLSDEYVRLDNIVFPDLLKKILLVFSVHNLTNLAAHLNKTYQLMRFISFNFNTKLARGPYSRLVTDRIVNEYFY